MQNPNDYNWVLKHSDVPLKFAHLQGDVDKCAKVQPLKYNNAVCDACGHPCGLLYFVRCYEKRAATFTPEAHVDSDKFRKNFLHRTSHFGRPVLGPVTADFIDRGPVFESALQYLYVSVSKCVVLIPDLVI